MARIFRDAASAGLTADHTVPLQNPLVCGLNVPWNLKQMSRAENSSKSNYFFPNGPP